MPCDAIAVAKGQVSLDLARELDGLGLETVVQAVPQAGYRVTDFLTMILDLVRCNANPIRLVLYWQQSQAAGMEANRLWCKSHKEEAV